MKAGQLGHTHNDLPYLEHVVIVMARAVVISWNMNNMGTLQWTGWNARCLERDNEGVEGWTMGKVSPSPADYGV